MRLRSADPVAEAFGPQIWLLAGGLITGVLGISGLYIPAVMNFEEGGGDNAPAAKAPVPEGD